MTSSEGSAAFSLFLHQLFFCLQSSAFLLSESFLSALDSPVTRGGTALTTAWSHTLVHIIAAPLKTQHYQLQLRLYLRPIHKILQGVLSDSVLCLVQPQSSGLGPAISLNKSILQKRFPNLQ